MQINSNGNVGIGTTSPLAKLSVQGPDTGTTPEFILANSANTTELSVLDNGNATLAGTLTQNSDQRLKTNISTLDASTSLAEIVALNPVAYNWIDPSKASTTQYGFIAQQVESVLPNLVSTTSPTALTPDGTLGLNYLGFIAPLVRAVQAIYADITSLENTIAGFAQSFTSAKVTTNELCVTKSDGSLLCVTGDQLAAALAAVSASPAPSQQQTSLSTAASTPATDPTTTPLGSSTPPDSNLLQNDVASSTVDITPEIPLAPASSTPSLASTSPVQ